MSKIKDMPVTADVMDLVRKVDELVLVVRANNTETQIMRQLVGKEYRIVHNDINRTAKALEDILEIIRTKDVQKQVEDIAGKCRSVQRMLQAQIIRSATVTEVTRFIRIEQPKLLNDCMQKLLDMHDKPDSWWEARRMLAVWEWGAMLYPEFKRDWEAKYYIKPDAKKKKNGRQIVDAFEKAADDFDEETPLEEVPAEEEDDE